VTSTIHVPPSVQALLDRLWAAGHAAYVVGGSIRDELLGREAADWDLATDARPVRMLEIFPGAVYENRFGTVAVRSGEDVHEITTFRSDHEYADHRRPHRIEFGDDIRLDLARRDFTVNAMAWGADAPAAGTSPAGASPAGASQAASLVDPYNGAADVASRTIRAVGDPTVRFEEDALRMVRAVRLAATLDFEIEPATRAAIEARAELVAHLSGERIAAELDLLLAAPEPSRGLRLLADTGVLAVISPALAAQRGVPQNKVPGEDLLDHTLRSVDAAPASRPVVRLAALLHDIGKPATLDDGPFRGHETVGAELAESFLEGLHLQRATTERVVHLVRHHMFTYEAAWTDGAVRRFIQRVTLPAVDDLFELRAADNIGSGVAADAHGLSELRDRVQGQLAASVPLDLRQLAIHGDDLMAELGIPPGPALGRILDALLDRVVTDPALNDRATLLLLARSMVDEAR
jgi:tRNA nucleotidyltransferase (CCA-adding enzyme)